MTKMLCTRCAKVLLPNKTGTCSHCGSKKTEMHNFTNSDDFLRQETVKVMEMRHQSGMEGLVRGLAAIIINTEENRQFAAVDEFISKTGYNFASAFQCGKFRTCVLRHPQSADILIRSRKTNTNPFAEYNGFPKSMHLPNTRLETFVFHVNDIEKYVSAQKARGARFLSDIQHYDHYDFIQTAPVPAMGTSIGVIQWKKNNGHYGSSEHQPLDRTFKKPDWPHLENIGFLDHTATRVQAVDRDEVILEFMRLTNYHFDFSVYVKMFNSITNVARLKQGEFAMVFTSGIHPYINDELSGPTEKFIHNTGARVHHLAFDTVHIDDTFQALKNKGQKFLVDLVGSEEEGLKQTFTEPSPNTLLVNEYIHRYGDFDGFFTKSNVTILTGATDKQ